MLSTDSLVTDSQAVVADVFKGLRKDLLKAYGNIERMQKADHSSLTVWDTKIEETLRAKLKEAFPTLGFEGEETGHSGDEKTYWLVDPIDGTSSFIRGLPYCTNMGALVHEGHVLAAVIYDFVNDVLYTARKGQGAFKDDKKIHINTTRQLGNLVLYSFLRHKFGHLQEALKELHMRGLLLMGGAGHTYAMLAEGKIDGIVCLTAKMGLYDNAPGMLLVEEAGAKVLSYDDEVGVNRREFIVGSPLVVDTIERSGLI